MKAERVNTQQEGKSLEACQLLNSNKTLKITTGTIKGVVATLLWVVTIVTSAVSVQLLRRRIPDFELNTFRCASPLVCCFVITMVTRKLPWIPRQQIPATVAYSSLSVFGALCQYIAVTFLPVSTVQCIFITSGMLSGLVLFAIFCEEKITVRNIICAFVCICGVVLLIQPAFDKIFKKTLSNEMQENVGFGGHNNTAFHYGKDYDDQQQQEIETFESWHNRPLQKTKTQTWKKILGYVLSVLPGGMMSLDVLVLKKYTFLNENKTSVLFWSFAMGTAFSAIVMAIFESPVSPINWLQILYIFTHCISYVLMWPLYMFAVQHISGNTFNMIFCTSVVLMLIPQYTVLSSIHPGHRNWMEVLGVVLVLVGATFGSVLEILKSKS